MKTRVFVLFWFGFGYWVAAFWEMAAHSVNHVFSFVFWLWLFVMLVIPRFGFGGWVWVLIASVQDLCVLLTSIDE